MSSLYNIYLNNLSTDVGAAARSLYEQVCSDVNRPQFIPDMKTCTDEVDTNEYFDKPTLSEEEQAVSEISKVGAGKMTIEGKPQTRNPAPGRDSNGIMGTPFSQNTCASTATPT